MGPTQSSLQRVPGSPSPRVKRPRCGTDHSPLSNAEDKNDYVAISWNLFSKIILSPIIATTWKSRITRNYRSLLISRNIPTSKCDVLWNYKYVSCRWLCVTCFAILQYTCTFLSVTDKYTKTIVANQKMKAFHQCKHTCLRFFGMWLCYIRT
jgi:hypothetical protein